MIKPIGSDELQPRFVYDVAEHDALSKEAESLPSVVISSQAAGNAVMMGAGYFNPLKGFMNVADAMGAGEKLERCNKGSTKKICRRVSLVVGEYLCIIID